MTLILDGRPNDNAMKTSTTHKNRSTRDPETLSFVVRLDFQPIPDGTSNVSYLPAIRLTARTVVHIILATD